MGVPIKIIVYGVIDAAAVFPSQSDMELANTIVLQKGRIVRTRTERGNAQILAFTYFFALVSGLGGRDLMQSATLPRRKLRFRVGYVARHIVAEFFQRM